MKSLINKRYFQLIFLCFFAYMISYIGRLGYNTNIQNFIDSYQITKLEAGYASSAFFFCYGAGQLINAILCERMNSVKAVSGSLFISSLISLSLFFIRNILLISIVWGLNGFILSTLWSNLIKLTAKIKDKKHLDKSITWLAISLPVGTLFAYSATSIFTLANIWKIYFIVSSLIMLLGSLIFFVGTRKVEKDIATLATEELNTVNDLKPDSNNKVSLLKFLSIAIIPIFFISVLSSIIKDGVQTWMPTYLKENFELPTYFSILITLILPLFGLMAVILAKRLVKRFNNIYIALIAIFIASILLITMFIVFGAFAAIIPIIIFALLSLTMHASNSVFTAIFPIHYKDKIKSGPTAGILNCFAYVGSSISTFSLGGIVDSFGWNAFSITLLSCAAVAAALSIWSYFSMKCK